MLTSDKPVYQPGDVIHLRSLTLAQPQHKPVAGQEIVFSVSDPKGNVVFRQRDVTSRFGIAALNCPLATEIIEGAYQIHCAVGDTTSALAVQVEKYVLPKFKLTVDLDEPYYAPGQRVRGTVTARYFFGKAVDRGQVQIEAASTDFLVAANSPTWRSKPTQRERPSSNSSCRHRSSADRKIQATPASRSPPRCTTPRAKRRRRPYRES